MDSGMSRTLIESKSLSERLNALEGASDGVATCGADGLMVDWKRMAVPPSIMGVVRRMLGRRFNLENDTEA